MTNIRITKLLVRSSIQVDVHFTSNLDTRVGLDNVAIKGAGGGISDLNVISATVLGNVLSVGVRPMIPMGYYEFILSSTSQQQVRGAKGETFIEDGFTNHVFFMGVQESNDIRDAILDGLPKIYNTDANTLIFKAIDAGAKEILDVVHDAGEVKSANYVSIEIADEQITRGAGPYDRFSHEGAFQILRVGSDATGATEKGRISFDSFPADPVSLQQIFVNEEVVSNLSGSPNSFVGLLINLTNKPVIMVTSIVLIRDSIEYEYDLEQYKYGIKENKYDSENSYLALDLNDGQIRLNDAAVPGFPYPQGNDEIVVSYYYKRVGRNVSSTSVKIFSALDAIRESVPAVATLFYLAHAPVINSYGNVPTTNGVVWLDPNMNFDPTSKHPAFLFELAYNQSNLPKAPGEFSVNYNTGQVFVFGVDGSGTDGTTVIPPVATYKFEKTYQDGLDYVFSTDLNEIASMPDRDLRYSSATVSFDYEDDFAEGTDFLFASHIEVASERVNNRLIENIGVKSLYSPVREVFRIFNETTGEIYTPTRTYGNEIYFSGTNLPVILNSTRESAEFEQIIQSQLIVTDDTTALAGRLFVVKLSDYNIIAGTGDFVGASFNSSLHFSDDTVFVREIYYDLLDTLSDNLIRLQSIGDYMVDYVYGIAYVIVSITESLSVGDASYRRGRIKTRHKHITRASDVYRSASPTALNARTFVVSHIYDDTIELLGQSSATPADAYGYLEQVGERFVGSNAIIVENTSIGNTITVSQDIFRLRHIFQVSDLHTTYEPIDFMEGATIFSSSPNIVILGASGVMIRDDSSGLAVQAAGTRRFIIAERLAYMALMGLAELKSALSVQDLSSGENYYSQGADGYVDVITNRIYLPSTTSAIIGTVVVANYRAALRGGAAVLVDYTPGNIFVDYSYSRDEILISYEYGDNVLDWGISNTLFEGDTYYVSYRYGALRNALRDNFGVLTSIEELSTIPDNLDRETYRHAVAGALQSFIKGPTIPSIKKLVESITQINPNIIESAFLEWVLGRDYLHLLPMKLNANITEELPTFLPGKFGDGLFLDKDGQTASIPANSNLRMAEGTWEAFVVPYWDGIDNDAELAFDVFFDGVRDVNRVFIGSSNIHPESIPFTLGKDDLGVLGRPSLLHDETGYFVWYDTTAKKWRLRTRALVGDSRLFTGRITTTGEFYNVKVATTADGYDGYDSQIINEDNDRLWSTDESVRFSFVVDAYDVLNISFDAYDVETGDFYGFDGIDFTSDNIHYLFDTGADRNYDRMSLYKDGKGFLKFRAYDSNRRVKILSANIHDVLAESVGRNWKRQETHHVAVSWKIGTVEMLDEMHLFIDGQEIENTYRFSGYLNPLVNAKYMDGAREILDTYAIVPTIGGFDLVTTVGSNVVTSASAQFVVSGIQTDFRFVILDDTPDGIATRTSPYVYVKSVIDNHTLHLKTGLGVDYSVISGLTRVKYSINPLTLKTVTDPLVEKIRVFKENTVETELNSPSSLVPDYNYNKDGYQSYVEIYNGVEIGDAIILKTYGLVVSRSIQLAYIWPDLKTNILDTITPTPISVADINITNLITRKVALEIGFFALVATNVGGHLISSLSASLDYCQPSNTVTGRRLAAIISGDNFDFTGINKVYFMGDTTDGYDMEVLDFIDTGRQVTTKYFTSIVDIFAVFTPTDVLKKIGLIEIREALPINMQDNGGEYAEVHLSVQDQNGSDGYAAIGTRRFTDTTARFGSEDIGKYLNITFPSAIAGTYSIVDVPLDPSGVVKDSDTVILGSAWGVNCLNAVWRVINTSYGDSGFANGLITLEIVGSGGLPFLLRSCWYEIDFPTYVTIPWDRMPDSLYVGSDMFGTHPTNAVVDEMRILDEMSTDTRRGESTASSGRSITTDARVVKEYSKTTQTLGLFHFNNNVINSADFISGFSGSYRQSENSVNANFEQSAVFNSKNAMIVDNKSIFGNNSGTIEFWVSPILDTYNDPTPRYYIDLSSEQVMEIQAASGTFGIVSPMTIILPMQVRSVSSVVLTYGNQETNYFNGGELAIDRQTVRLGLPLPTGTQSVMVSYTPLASQGDRFSILKDENGFLVLAVSASEVDFQISVPAYWKKNTWHRVFAGWDLNNTDNQDRLILVVDGVEGGAIRYGTGFKYGTGFRYGMSTVWGSARAGTVAARNILTDINLTDIFNQIYIGADFTEQFTAMARMDNIRFSSELRRITYLGGSGPGQLLARDLLYTNNVNTAQPVVSDALTRLLLDFNTPHTEVEYLATIRDNATGIFDFYVEIIDVFDLADTDLIKSMIKSLINRIKPAHTRAFTSFVK